MGYRTELTVYHGVLQPLGVIFRARLLDNQEGAKTERYVFGKLSARCFQRRPLWYLHYSNFGDIDHGKSAQEGCDVQCRTGTVLRYYPKLVVLGRYSRATKSLDATLTGAHGDVSHDSLYRLTEQVAYVAALNCPVPSRRRLEIIRTAVEQGGISAVNLYCLRSACSRFVCVMASCRGVSPRRCRARGHQGQIC